MITADPLLFSRVRDAYPERWKKAEPGNALVNECETEGTFSVRREGGEWHKCSLAVAHGEFVGTCDCEGFEFHDGACSHLCAVYRLRADEGHPFPSVRPSAYRVELRSEEERRADGQEELVATDGGTR